MLKASFLRALQSAIRKDFVKRWLQLVGMHVWSCSQRDLKSFFVRPVEVDGIVRFCLEIYNEMQVNCLLVDRQDRSPEFLFFVRRMKVSWQTCGLYWLEHTLCG